MSVDRDRILEQALKHELRGDTAVTPHCLDAEMLAAWQDDALNAAQMADIEQHVSTCERCQSMLAAFARGTADAPGTPAPVAEGNVSWWRWWMAPIAAGAAAVTLWMVVPEQQQVATRPPTPAASVAVGKVQPPASVEEKKADAPAAEVETRARAAERDSADSKLKANVARDERQQLKDQPATAAKEEVALAQPPPPPAAPASPPPPAALAAPAAQPQAAGARADELQKSAQFAFTQLVISPDPTRQWRFGNAGVERSEDGGTTWNLVWKSQGESLTVGMSPSRNVCWLGGRSGVILISRDGSSFVRMELFPPILDAGPGVRVVPPPPPPSDIVSIAATDDRSATVTTADGRRFRTDDGGRTWRPL